MGPCRLSVGRLALVPGGSAEWLPLSLSTCTACILNGVITPTRSLFDFENIEHGQQSRQVFSARIITLSAAYGVGLDTTSLTIVLSL